MLAAGLTGSLATRLIAEGMSMPTWRVIHERMGALTFSHSSVMARTSGYLGWFEDKGGRVVGWLGKDGALLKWTGRRDALQHAPLDMRAKFVAAPPGNLKFVERIGTAVPLDPRNQVNW